MITQVRMIQSIQKAANAPERDEESAMTRLLDVLSKTVWSRHKNHHRNVWELALCKLILSINPGIKKLDVSESVPYGTQALDQVGLLNTLANLGYVSKHTKTRLDQIDERLCPCLFIADNAPDSPDIVLENRMIYRSEKNSMMPLAECPATEGTIFFFQPHDSMQESVSKQARQATGYSWFRALMQRFHGTIGHILLAGLVLNLIGLSTPLFIMLVYDRVISSHAVNVLPFLALGVALAIIAEGALRYVRSKSLSWLGGRLDNIVSNWIFGHLMQLAPAYIEWASVPSQVARIKTFESIRDFFSGSVFMSVLELPFMIIALIVIGLIAGPLVLVPIGAAVLYGVLFYAIWRKVRVVIRAAAKDSSARQQFSLETFEKAEAIRANGLGTIWSQKFRDLSGREALSQFQLGWLGVVGESAANTLTILSAVAVIGFGVHLVWAGVMTTGALVATMILVWRVLGPFYSLCTMVPRLEQLRNSIRQINTLMDIDTEEATARGLARPGRLNGRISFINAHLRYNPNDNPVFSNLSFEARPGDIVAITGENGAGKTSLLKVIKGMYPPSEGNVRIDGFDIRQLNPHDLRRNMAYIPQNPDFFYGTIAENLRFGNPLASDDEIRQALGQAHVLDDVMAMPDQLNTMIGGDDGMDLSSSMAVRLSMVRAYLHEAPIMLIDELPNSILTEDAGRFLYDTILRQRGKQTIFIVTYREDFLRMANSIVFLRTNFPSQAGDSATMLQTLKKMQW